MEQYSQIKAKHADEILLFRLGDFYEMFYEDAKTASKVLGIVLTSRSKGDARIPMCGIPFHSSQSYINRLLKAGHRVAVCEQLQDPEEADGIVERGVVRVITPGTLVEESILEEKKNNYLAAAVNDGPKTGLAWVDLSTGEFRLADLPGERLPDELVRLGPSETLLPSSVAETQGPRVQAAAGGILTPYHDWTFDRDNAKRLLCEHFEVKSLRGFGCEELGPAVAAAGAVLSYLKETQKGPLAHLTRLERYVGEGRMFLDRQTQASLELTETLRSGERKGSLLWVLDKTRTPMGARLLREWVTSPLLRVDDIKGRLGAVKELVEDEALRTQVQEQLKLIFDLERALARVGAGRANARDLVGLRASLQPLPTLASIKFKAKGLALKIGRHAELAAFLGKALQDDPPNLLTEGGIVRRGFDAELDKLHAISTDGKSWIANFESEEIRRSGIPSLKVGYTQVFGYYIEITNAHKEKIPANYVRKQTLKNAERYITPELKDYESLVLNAEDKLKDLEYEVFQKIRARVAEEIAELQQTARSLALLDAAASLAQTAVENKYVLPEVDESTTYDVRDGRHPVLEVMIEEKVVPNDVVLTGDKPVAMITGPNMAGKSTYIRQAALAALMAQMGSYVPAGSAKLGIVDRIFTRIGAADELTRGQSTFMVEMSETANILNNATNRSLIILDEIGRGTSTFDGVSIAWAVTEYLHDKLKARTLFATHYHELTELGRVLKGVRNLHVSVKEWGEGIVFLHRIVEGPTDKSYGIHVARLAGIPKPVVERSKVILAGLEAMTLDQSDRPKLTAQKPKPGELQQLALFAGAPTKLERDPIRDELGAVDYNKLSPIDALKKLADFVERSRIKK
ncbi:MAG: DNA mismatch repair protein MutS [Planctomycetaceae bacterium]|nr:DNA mismatch repair protein MutS [Planctomycetaceae bacterium]